MNEPFRFCACKFYFLTDTKKYAQTFLSNIHGVLKYKLFQANIPVEIISPSEVKKKATGKGNADKKAMHMAFMQETGYNLKTLITPDKKEVTNPVSDIVDSYFVCKALFGKLKEALEN